MSELLEVTNGRQHRENGFDEHPDIPRAAFAEFQVDGIPFLGMKLLIGAHNHLLVHLLDQWLEHTIMHVRRIRCPADNQAPLIEQ